jgi:hypothetical protein
MSMPKASGDKRMEMGREGGAISTKKHDEKWVNPETHVGQPSCREEIKKAEKTHAK